MNTPNKAISLDPKSSLPTKLILYTSLAVFYVYSVFWCITRRNSVKSTRDVLRIFYYDFLRLRREHILIEKLTRRELIVISVNPCPILKLSQLLRVDTRYSCKLVSETVCKMVLKCLNPNLVFTRDYNYIRPYSSGCRERIFFKEKVN